MAEIANTGSFNYSGNYTKSYNRHVAHEELDSSHSKFDPPIRRGLNKRDEMFESPSWVNNNLLKNFKII